MQQLPIEMPQLSNYGPYVSMDAAYSRHIPTGQVLNFDVDAYQAGVDQLAKYCVNLDGLEILLTPYLSDGSRGKYIYGSNHRQITIAARPDNLTEAEKALRHETRHLIDDTEGRLHRNNLVSKVSYTLGSKIMTSVCAGIGVGFIFGMEIPPLPADVVIGGYIVSGLVTGLSASSILRYHYAPTELRARRAEQAETPCVLSIAQE